MNNFIFNNSEKCIGCRACEVACILAHNNEKYPFHTEKRSARIHIIEKHNVTITQVCHQCENAPCLHQCPEHAIINIDNAIQIVAEKCTGCGKCLSSCPLHALSLVKDAIEKCDLCDSRANNQGPACVQACPTKALTEFNMQKLEVFRKQRLHREISDKESSLSPLILQQMNTVSHRLEPIKLPAEERKTHFDEIYPIFTPEALNDAAERCLKCSENAFCRLRCPLHNAIPEWITLAQEGKIIEAAECCHQTSCMPEICGRVCPQEKLCESGCTLSAKNGAITIGHIERFITDKAFALGWKPKPISNEFKHIRIAVIGAGPAGLACAEYLARRGVNVDVFERHPEIGGLLTFGIPPFKLDKQHLSQRRKLFSEMGIHFHLQTEVGKDISINALLDDYDLIYLAVGTYHSMPAGLKNENSQGIIKALPYLIANTYRLMSLKDDPHQPYISLANKRVIVLGGGDTAMDCIRTAIRQGASHVICAYRRDENNMPGSKKEVKNAKEEGAEFLFNVQPLRIDLNNDNTFRGITMVKTALGEPDSSGRRRPHPIADSEFILEADVLIMALGFRAHKMPWLKDADVQCDQYGHIITHKNRRWYGQTTHPRIFAGGDVIRGADLVVTAMADGRRTARDMLNLIQKNKQ